MRFGIADHCADYLYATLDGLDQFGARQRAYARSLLIRSDLLRA
jgi:hypothetical protein